MILPRIDRQPDDRALRTFGIAGLVVFGALATVVRLTGHLLGLPIPSAQCAPLALTLLLASLSTGALAVTAPRLLRPLHLTLSVLAWPIGLVVSELILLSVYALVFTPFGVVMRALGRDTMGKKFDRAAPTYWVRRSPSRPRRYLRQY